MAIENLTGSWRALHDAATEATATVEGERETRLRKPPTQVFSPPPALDQEDDDQ